MSPDISSYTYRYSPESIGIAAMSGLGILLVVIRAAIAIYLLVIFSKLAFRGIKALDIYINEKTRDK
ncbi:MAG TPA: hypothetical protein GX527_05900 [Clostridiaceae bacterium]|jgi:hypothetical protein|nr:hypothetical protein [Clostridiaceae bacterium]